MYNLGSVGLHNKNCANLFHSSNLKTIRGPKLLETVRNGKTPTFLKVWFLENVKFVKVFSHHKFIQDSQEDFKHLEFAHILHMRRYRIRWKMLKMNKNRKIFQTNSHKSYEILQRIYIRHRMTSHEYYQPNTKRKVRFIEISARKLHLGVVILGLKVQFF